MMWLAKFIWDSFAFFTVFLFVSPYVADQLGVVGRISLLWVVAPAGVATMAKAEMCGWYE